MTITIKPKTFDVKEAMKTAFATAQDMGFLHAEPPHKPLTPRQAAAAEKKAKKAHAKWTAAHKKQQLDEKRFELFCQVYVFTRLEKKSQHLTLDKSTLKECVEESWTIVDEMMAQAPAQPAYATIGMGHILSGCGH